VELLRNAIRISHRCSHRVLPRLINVIESAAGPMLVYEWVDGELLRKYRDQPRCAHERFRQLPLERILGVLDEIFDLHRVLAAMGLVAVDFYDGCLIYDFDRAALHVVDLDGYRQGAFVNSMGRMFGSSRFMAPEEFEHGRRIDQRTTGFTLGRTAAVFLSGGTLDRTRFPAGDELYEVVERACRPLPQDRPASVGEFCQAWLKARQAAG
jgi:serine/threonine-protein kinase